jgi:predicted Rossmann fold flavoprotein
MADLVDVLIVGAGAAGMMCAIEAGKRGRRVLVVDHARAPGEKIRISGGGRCNFTNTGTGVANFLGENPRFAASALKRYSQHDFIKRVDRQGIAWHEKTLGQLFCDDSAKQIIRMLTEDMRAAGVTLRLDTGVGWGYSLRRRVRSAAVRRRRRARRVSGAWRPGASRSPRWERPAGAMISRGSSACRVTETRPALVPLTFETGLLEQLAAARGRRG